MNKAFNHSDAAVLTNGTGPRFDMLALEPAFEAIGDKYVVLVTN